MRALVSAAEMRAAEEEAATEELSSPALMQLAGHGAARALLDSPNGARQQYLVLAGPGNNGGDALVVAGLLHAAGAGVQVITYRRTKSSPVDPVGVPRFDMAGDPHGERLHDALLRCDVVVDGILGTGRTRPPGPDLVAILNSIRQSPRHFRIVALDLPTGVDADSGAVDDATLTADQTLTFGYMKRGLVLYPARAYCGDLRVIDIGLPDPPRVPVSTFAPDHVDVAAWLPKRTPTMQKYSAGAVLALAGSPHYVGAPILCSMAAMRSGAGYVTVATTENAVAALAPRLLEPTMLTLPSEDGAVRTEEALQRMEEVASRYSALLIGPGLGRAPDTIQLVLKVLGGALHGPRAAVVDADALFALAETPDWPGKLAIPIVLTPHTGEMARLTGLKSQEIEADRYTVASTWARHWNQVLVLKGAPTIVASPTGELSVNLTGNALLATAGSGDVLSGVIAAFLAGGVAPFEAARAAVYVHGLAADLAAPTYGDRGMLAGDLLPLLPNAIKAVLASA